MGRDPAPISTPTRGRNFNPLSPHGERLKEIATISGATRFQSTLPAWGETGSVGMTDMATAYFNPLSPHGERRFFLPGGPRASGDFNPLSPHGERPSRGSTRSGPMNFNPLSPHGERRRWISPMCGGNPHFNPLSPHGERRLAGAVGRAPGHFNPLSPHGERPSPDCCLIWVEDFNPLSPHGERPRWSGTPPSIRRFQSTLPAWGETANAHNFSKRKTGASAQHCIFSPAKRFFLLTKNFLEKRNKPFFRCEPYSKTVGAPVSHQPLKN